jgi:hypothetical protein
MKNQPSPISNIHSQVQSRTLPALSARLAARLLMALLLIATGLAWAQTDVPGIINYQGKLTDELGNPVAPGYYEVQFKIWDHPTLTNPSDYIWGRAFALHVVTNGMFNVLLSDTGGIVGTPKTNSLLAAFNGADRFLGLTITKTPSGNVASPSEISPRQQLVTAPYAIHAHNASMLDNFEPSAFLMANKSAQLITGNLTLTEGNLTLNDNLIVDDDITLHGNLTVDKNITGKGNLTLTGTMAPLTFASSLGDKIGLYGSFGIPHYGLGIQSHLLQLHGDSSSSDIAFGYGQSTNFTESMRVKGSGKVGIGTSSPEATLHVRGTTMLDLGGTGGGALTIFSNPNDNQIYLEGYSSNHSASATAINITGYGANPLQTFNVSANAVKVKNVMPIVVRTYYLPQIAANDNVAHTYNSGYPTNLWSAVIVGFHIDGDIYESDLTRPLIKVRMERIAGQANWHIVYGMAHQSDPLYVTVDAMFIRRELADDNR